MGKREATAHYLDFVGKYVQGILRNSAVIGGRLISANRNLPRILEMNLG
jgi:hypothetical protein